MNLAVITEPTVEPVTAVDLFNSHAKLDQIATTITESTTLQSANYSASSTNGTSVNITGTEATVIINCGVVITTPLPKVYIQDSPDDIVWTIKATYSPVTNQNIQYKYTGSNPYLRVAIFNIASSIQCGAVIVKRALPVNEATIIDQYISAARKYAENQIDRKFISTALRVCFDSFNCNCCNQISLPIASNQISLPIANVLSVESVKYLDPAGTLQTISSANYYVDTYSNPARIIPVNSWPQIHWRMPNAVQIAFTAGYGATAASVPTTIKQAILLLAAHFYENRSDTIEGNLNNIPTGVQSLLNGEKWV